MLYFENLRPLASDPINCYENYESLFQILKLAFSKNDSKLIPRRRRIARSSAPHC